MFQAIQHGLLPVDGTFGALTLGFRRTPVQLNECLPVLDQVTFDNRHALDSTFDLRGDDGRPLRNGHQHPHEVNGGTQRHPLRPGYLNGDRFWLLGAFLPFGRSLGHTARKGDHTKQQECAADRRPSQ